MKLIAGKANEALAYDIVNRISRLDPQASMAKTELKRHKDEEIWVEIHENVRGEDVFVVQSTSRPANDRLMEILIITDALRRASAGRITAVIPYYGYARQDRKTATRTPVSAKLVANLLTTSGIDRVLTLDLHAGQIQAFFDIPCDNLYAAPLFALDVRHHLHQLGNLTVVSPDVGGMVRARDLAKRINADLAVVDKRRSAPGQVDGMTVIGDVRGRTCLIVDDIVDTAGTLTMAAELLIKEGATAVHGYVSHGVLSDPALQRIESSAISSLVITDSITQPGGVLASSKIRIISLAPLLAQAMINVSNDTSVSSLFDETQVASLYEV